MVAIMDVERSLELFISYLHYVLSVRFQMLAFSFLKHIQVVLLFKIRKFNAGRK